MRISWLLLAAGFALMIAGAAGGGTEADSAKAALEGELGALLREIDRPMAEDVFEDGRRADLVVLSSHSVMGEVAPCG